MKEQQQRIIQNYIDAYNNFDVDGMATDLDETVVFENVSNGNVDLRTEGLQAFVQQAEAAKAYFTERQQRIESWSFEDTTISIEIAYSAVLATDLPNGLKKGESLELKGTSTFGFENGRIKSITDRS